MAGPAQKLFGTGTPPVQIFLFWRYSKSEFQLGWVIKLVPHNLVWRIRFLTIKSFEKDFKYFHREECSQPDHPTGKTYLAHCGCQVLVLWLSMTPVLHFTNCIHNHSTPLTTHNPRQKANTTVEQLRKGNPCHAVLVSLRKKVSLKNKNAGKKHGLSRLKSTFLFVYDPIVFFCLQNSSLTIR